MVESYCGDYSTNFLEGLVIMEDPKYGYSDPDDGYKIEGNEYYTNIVKFLNEREKDAQYKFVKGNGIEVNFGNETLLLRSDQFGFSAPQISTSTRFLGCDNKYPYWRYLHLSTRGSKYWKVIEWINNTRTIGGLFVWPVWRKGDNDKLYSRYNQNRGVGSYIEDSVDLTLYEIKHYYDWINCEENKDKDITKDYTYKDDVLYKTEIESEKSPMVTWLNHFGTFEKYIDFFLLNDFVCEVKNNNTKKYIPIDLVDEKPLKDNRVKGYMDDFNKKGKDKKRRIANKERKPEELEKIFNRLSYMTLMRTARMLKVINNSESSKS